MRRRPRPRGAIAGPEHHPLDALETHGRDKGAEQVPPRRAAELHDRRRRAAASRASLARESFHGEDRGSRATSRDEQRVGEGARAVRVFLVVRVVRVVSEHRAEALGGPVGAPALDALQRARYRREKAVLVLLHVLAPLK